MSESRWGFKDEPGKCLFCGKPLPIGRGSAYCSLVCEEKDTSQYERALERRKKENKHV